MQTDNPLVIGLIDLIELDLDEVSIEREILEHICLHMFYKIRLCMLLVEALMAYKSIINIC